MKPVYEVVSGSILLSKREDFFRLHRDWLLPMMHKIGIRPVLLLMTEIATLCHGDGPEGQGDRRRRSVVLAILLSNSYCARITTLYAPTPTLALKFSPSFPPGLAV